MRLLIYILLFVVLKIVQSTDNKPSPIYYVGGLGNSSTEIDGENDLTRANILSETKPLEKPQIAPPAFENNLNDLSSGTVYYEREQNGTEAKKNDESKPKRKEIVKGHGKKHYKAKPKRKKIEKGNEKKGHEAIPKRKEIKKKEVKKDHKSKPKRKEIVKGHGEKHYKAEPKRKEIEKGNEKGGHEAKPKRKEIKKEVEKKHHKTEPKEIEKEDAKKDHKVKPKRKEIEKSSREQKEQSSKPKRKDIEKRQKKKKDRKTVSHKIILKSSTLNRTGSPSVGEGLDLTKANILHQRSSPSIIKSCSGKPITLKCAAAGNPAPDFTWYKGKTPVDKQKVAEFDLDIAPSAFVRASHLTLTPKHKKDFDEYQCMANNNLGSSQQSMYKIKLEEKSTDVCKMMGDEKRKYNSIILGTFLSVGMLVAMLFVAGFVFWRLNFKDASEYQNLKDGESGQEDGTLEAAVYNNEEDSKGEDAMKGGSEDFYTLNAQEIGRLSSVLAADWERLARLLGFHQHDVDTMRQNSSKIESRCAEMLNKYRKKHGTRESLAEAVEELKDIETANAIRKMYYKFNPTQ